MKKQILMIALSIVAIGFSAVAGNDNKSTMSVNAKESKVVWLGKKVTGEHTGTIKISKGNLDFDNNKLTGGSFEIDMTSIVNTDIENDEYNQKLIGHLKSDDFFGVEKFPTSSFVIKNVKQLEGGKFHVTGDLTIKGITRSIEFPVQVSMSGAKANASATITVDRSKFDVRYGSGSFFDGLGDKMIYDDFTLNVSLSTN